MVEAAAVGHEQVARGWQWLVVTTALLCAVVVLLAGLFTAFGPGSPDRLGLDFRVAYYPAGAAVVDDRSPYPADPADPALDPRTLYAYPPQLAILVAPLTVLPIDIAAVVAVVMLGLALLGSLAIVGVRDVRCYAALFLWAPAWNTLEMANVSALLALLLAVVWRYRDTIWPFAAALGVAASLKLFLLPMLGWAAFTGRARGGLTAVGVGLCLSILAWAGVGFAGISNYPDLLESVAAQESYSIKAVVTALGAGSAVATVASLVVACGLLVLCGWFGRRADESRAFLLAVLASLAVSPVVWLHYLVLLAVPLGLLRPRFSAVWLAPIALWPLSRAGPEGAFESLAPVFVVATIAVVLLVPEGGSRGRAAEAA